MGKRHTTTDKEKERGKDKTPPSKKSRPTHKTKVVFPLTAAQRKEAREVLTGVLENLRREDLESARAALGKDRPHS